METKIAIQDISLKKGLFLHNVAYSRQDILEEKL
jgi:hypothetical protein